MNVACYPALVLQNIIFCAMIRYTILDQIIRHSCVAFMSQKSTSFWEDWNIFRSCLPWFEGFILFEQVGGVLYIFWHFLFRWPVLRRQSCWMSVFTLPFWQRFLPILQFRQMVRIVFIFFSPTEFTKHMPYHTKLISHCLRPNFMNYFV